MCHAPMQPQPAHIATAGAPGQQQTQIQAALLLCVTPAVPGLCSKKHSAAPLHFVTARHPKSIMGHFGATVPASLWALCVMQPARTPHWTTMPLEMILTNSHLSDVWQMPAQHQMGLGTFLLLRELVCLCVTGLKGYGSGMVHGLIGVNPTSLHRLADSPKTKSALACASQATLAPPSGCAAQWVASRVTEQETASRSYLE